MEELRNPYGGNAVRLSVAATLVISCLAVTVVSGQGAVDSTPRRFDGLLPISDTVQRLADEAGLTVVRSEQSGKTVIAGPQWIVKGERFFPGPAIGMTLLCSTDGPPEGAEQSDCVFAFASAVPLEWSSANDRSLSLMADDSMTVTLLPGGLNGASLPADSVSQWASYRLSRDDISAFARARHVRGTAAGYPIVLNVEHLKEIRAVWSILQLHRP